MTNQKFKVGDSVVLNSDGRRELPRLRRKIGVVIEAPSKLGRATLLIEWGRARYRMIHSEDNLSLVNPTPTAKK